MEGGKKTSENNPLEYGKSLNAEGAGQPLPAESQGYAGESRSLGERAVSMKAIRSNLPQHSHLKAAPQGTPIDALRLLRAGRVSQGNPWILDLGFLILDQESPVSEHFAFCLFFSASLRVLCVK